MTQRDYSTISPSARQHNVEANKFASFAAAEQPFGEMGVRAH